MPKAEKPRSTAQKVDLALKKNKLLQGEKTNWNIHWQAIGENFLTRKSDFTASRTQGEFLNDELFDGTGPGALMKFASAILGMVWPNGARSIRMKKPRRMKETDEVKKYYEGATEILTYEMDRPRAGLQVSLDEFMIDQGAFGTSGVSCMPGKKTKLSFKAENVKTMCIDEGPDGFVDTVYIEIEWSIRQAATEYGLENLHAETQKKFKDGKEEDKVKILFLVQPRMYKEQGKEGIHGMDFESLHIEMEKKHLIRESGFKDIPIKVSRIRKALSEKYGRSPAMEALPDVQEINALWEAVTIAVEKQVDPPLVLLDDGVLGGNEVDTSAGALNVFNVAGRAGTGKPIEPLFTVEGIQDAAGLIERLENKIANHFMLDRLLDFNNENEMTLGEVNVRNRIRGFLLGSIFARLTAELFSPLVDRAVEILWEAGELGVIDGSAEYNELLAKGSDPEEILVIPQSIVKRMQTKDGKLSAPPFEIEYISPAARILQSEQAQGIIQTLDYVISAFQVNPEVADNINFDEATKIHSYISGAPSQILNSDETKEAIRKGRQEALQQQQAIEAAPKAADAAKKAAEAKSLQANSFPLRGGKNGRKAA